MKGSLAGDPLRLVVPKALVPGSDGHRFPRICPQTPALRVDSSPQPTTISHGGLRLQLLNYPSCQDLSTGSSGVSHSLVGSPFPYEPGPAGLDKRVYPPRDPSCQDRDCPGQWAPVKVSLESHLLITASLSPEHRSNLIRGPDS